MERTNLAFPRRIKRNKRHVDGLKTSANRVIEFERAA